MKAKELLQKLNACSKAITWAEDKTIQEAWDTCPRGDWMLWFYQKQYPNNIKELTLAKGHCANTVRHLMKDPRSLAAVDAAIAFGEGRLDEDGLKADYAAAAAAYAAAAAAYTAADAAAYAAAAAADDAADDAAAAAYAAAAAADDAAAAAYVSGQDNRQQTADICRKYLTIESLK